MNIESLRPVELGMGIALSVLLLLIGHWFPYHLWNGREMTWIERYVYGTTCLLAGFSLWRLLIGDLITPLGLLSIDAASGLAVLSAYWYDDLALARSKARKAEKLVK